jgi:hypothetical protein
MSLYGYRSGRPQTAPQYPPAWAVYLSRWTPRSTLI